MEKRYLTMKEISAFEMNLLEEEKSKNTISKYIRDVKAFSAFCTGNITKETVISYKQSLIQNGYSARSINSMLASLNSLFLFLNWSDLKVKALRVQHQVFYPEEKELTKAEYEKLCRTARENHNARLYMILQTICATGIRISELAYITVEAVQKGEVNISLKGKTRTIIIVGSLQEKLLQYIASKKISSGTVFVTRSRNPIDRTNIWRDMKKLCLKAEINPQKVFPHNLRHLFAREFYDLDKDIAKLADILGHSSIDTTRIYIISTSAEHRRLMEQMQLVN